MSERIWRLLASGAAVYGMLAGVQAWGLGIEVLSSSPDLVSGGDALLQLTDVSGNPYVTLLGQPSNVEFKADPNDPSKRLGVLYGLILGKNDVVVRVGRETASITLINHAINDSLFAGPQDSPFLCELDAFGLTPAVTAHLDPRRADCTAPPKIAYYYRNNDGKWMPFNATAERPSDIANDANGNPLIIRQEIGVINRAAYVITIPHDPAAGPPPTPTDQGGSSWNHKLVYSFGPGALSDGHLQGRSLGQLSPANQYTESNGDWYIMHGYALASSSLNRFGTSTDGVVSAESAYKVKEHFIEEFGPPMFTVGNGVSGGSMQQNIIANAYPGIVDGIVPGILFSDAMTFLQPLFDCELLVNVFKDGDWTREQLDAVSGKYWGYCVSNGTRYPGQLADNCDAAVLEMYDKTPSLGKPRCTFQDDLKQVFGIDPKTGVARSPWDNVGVQYGLKALNDGVINFAQFIDINKRIGGHDLDGNIVAERQVGDPQALAAAYATGQINETNGSYVDIPMVDFRSWRDGDPFGRGDANVDVHDGYHSLILQARLEKAHGNTDNSVQFLYARVSAERGADNAPDSPQTAATAEALPALDAWMTAIAMDKSDKTRAQKVVADKPAGLTNTCWTKGGKADGNPDQPDAKVERITDWARCRQIFATSTDARMVAGGPMTSDILKCQLKPIDAADYKAAPNADQLAQLKATFPNGVCDYSKPGVGQDAKLTTWASFTDYGQWNSLTN